MKPFKRKRLVVAINPTASFGKGRNVGPAVVQTLRALGHEVTALQEPDFEQLMASAAKAVAARPDAFIVVGGDGMVNLGTNLLVGTKVPLGIVPSGTGNDMARGLGIPLAAGVLFGAGILLPPALAAVFMSVSTIIVAGNAQLLRLLKLR